MSVVLSNGMVCGNTATSSSTATVNTAYIKSTSNIIANGQLISGSLTQGGTGRPTISSITANSNFTQINLGTCTSNNWIFMP